MANMVLSLGWEDKGYPMVIPRSGKPKLQIATYSKAEQREWEASLDVFESDQKEFTKDTLKGKPGKIGTKAGTGKEMYWVGLVPHYPDYANRSRISESLDIESDADEYDEEG